MCLGVQLPLEKKKKKKKKKLNICNGLGWCREAFVVKRIFLTLGVN